MGPQGWEWSSFFSFNLLIDFRERGRGSERERERNISLLIQLFMHSLVASCMYPDWGPNPQPWHIGIMR